MAAYFVYICQEVVDRSELETYWSKIGPTLEGYGARSVAAYTPFEQLEGDAVDGAAVVEFPSMGWRRPGIMLCSCSASAPTLSRGSESCESGLLRALLAIWDYEDKPCPPILTKAAKESASIFRIMCPRCN